MSVAVKEKPAPVARKKPLANIGKNLRNGFKKGLKALKGLKGLKALKAPRWLKRLTALRGRVSPVLANHARAHLSYLARQPAWRFVLIAGLWTLLLKTALVPFTALLSGLVFRPLGIATLFAPAPLLQLSDAITRGLYGPSHVGWTLLSAVVQLAIAAVLFPAVATLLAQLVPLESLARKVPSRKWRIYLSLAVMGLLYLVCWGELAFLVTGAVIGVPLTAVFLHWRNRASPGVACLVAGGVHAAANAAVILFHGIFGGL